MQSNSGKRAAYINTTLLPRQRRRGGHRMDSITRTSRTTETTETTLQSRDHRADNAAVGTRRRGRHQTATRSSCRGCSHCDAASGTLGCFSACCQGHRDTVRRVVFVLWMDGGSRSRVVDAIIGRTCQPDASMHVSTTTLRSLAMVWMESSRQWRWGHLEKSWRVRGGHHENDAIVAMKKMRHLEATRSSKGVYDAVVIRRITQRRDPRMDGTTRTRDVGARRTYGWDDLHFTVAMRRREASRGLDTVIEMSTRSWEGDDVSVIVMTARKVAIRRRGCHQTRADCRDDDAEFTRRTMLCRRVFMAIAMMASSSGDTVIAMDSMIHIATTMTRSRGITWVFSPSTRR